MDEENGNQELIDRIRAAEIAVQQAEGQLEEAKSVAKGAKDKFDLRVKQLREVIREIDQPALPFKGGEKWQDAIVLELGLSDGVVTKLADAGIETLGELHTYLKTKTLTDIDGIGAAAAEKIQDALETYWAEHPEQCEQEECNEPTSE